MTCSKIIIIEWLNHAAPPINPRPWLLLLGLPPLAIGLWMARGRYENLPSPFGRGAGGEGSSEGGETGADTAPPNALTLTLSHGERGQCDTAGLWLVLLAAGACGWVVASLAVTAAHRWAMPLPECARPQTRVVIDRTVSDAPLSKGPDTKGNGEGFGLLEQWISRLGCYTVRKEGAEAFSGDALVVICPNHSVSEEFAEQLTHYVFKGGKLLVIDSPENTRSTANSLLWPFGLSIRRDKVWKGKLNTTPQLPAVDVAKAYEVVGGKPVAKLDKLPVVAMTKYGDGSVMAIGCGSLWNDTRMGEHWMMDPDATVKARYDVLFPVLELFLKGKPLPLPPPEQPKKPTPELPMQESGPAEL